MIQPPCPILPEDPTEWDMYWMNYQYKDPTDTMRLSDFVRIFKDELGEILQESMKVMGKEHDQLKLWLDTRMKGREENFRLAMKEHNIPKEEWEIYWMLVELSDLEATKVKNRILKLRVYLDNIMNAYMLWRVEMGLAKDDDELNVEAARDTPITSLLSGKIIKSGKYLKTNCPFHGEKTPSFFIYPDNTYYCYGCGKGGDVISFVQELDGITFPEAVRRLTGGL